MLKMTSAHLTLKTTSAHLTLKMTSAHLTLKMTFAHLTLKMTSAHLTLKMTFAQGVETKRQSLPTNNLSEYSFHVDDRIPSIFSINLQWSIVNL